MELKDTRLTPLEARLVGRGSPFELVYESDAHGATRARFRHGPKSLIDIWRKAALASNQILMTDGTATLTNGDLFRQAGALAASFRKSFAVGANTRVAVVLRNRPEWALAFVAVTTAGASVAAIHAALDARSIAGCITNAGSALAIVECDIAEALYELGVSVPMLVVGKTALTRKPSGDIYDWEEYLALASGSAGSFDAPLPVEDNEALVAFTSGSTNRPKGVIVSHRSIVTGMMNAMLAGALSSIRRPKREQTQAGAAPVSMLVAPFSHVAGYMHFLSMLHVGGRLVTKPQIDGGAMADLVVAQRASSIVGAPPVLMRELLSRAGTSSDFESLRAIGLNGVHAPPQLLADIAATLPQVTVGTGYGLTETNGLICAGTTQDVDHEPLSCGRPLPTATVRIVRHDGKPAAVNEVGEIWVSGAMLADHYLHGLLDHTTAFEEGWFKTADAGRLDACGHLFAIGRMSQQISYRGSLLSSTQLEHLVLEDSHVHEAAVIDLSPQSERQKLAVAVVAHADQQVDRLGVQSRLAAMVRKEDLAIVTLPSLPRTATGKIDRAQLRALVLMENI